MLRKLDYTALEADLSALESLLATRSEEDDPIGYLQYSARVEEIKEKLRMLECSAERHAELEVVFGGDPLYGSLGMNADFVARVLADLQFLIAEKSAAMEARFSTSRGIQPPMNRPQLLLTHVLRGSVGFVLVEAGDTKASANTRLHKIVDGLTDIFWLVGADDRTMFESTASALGRNFLCALEGLFVYLDEQRATLRVVNGERDFFLDRNAVSAARFKIQKILPEAEREAPFGDR